MAFRQETISSKDKGMNLSSPKKEKGIYSFVFMWKADKELSSQIENIASRKNRNFSTL